jgi:hypothetical protein
LKFENHTYYNCEITLQDNTKYRVKANWLHNEGLDSWLGWTCDAGHRRLMIDENFNVSGGECLNDDLGNLFTEWRLLDKPTTCRQVRCTGCTDDLLQSKKENK